MLVLGVVAAVLLYRDAMTVRTSLLAAQASLEDVRRAAGDVELDAASAALARADEELAVARSRTGGPLWSMASVVPIAGDTVDTTRDVVAVVSAGVDVAERVLIDGAELLGSGLEVRVEDGQVDLAPLAEAGALLRDVPLERLADAAARLEANPPRWAPDLVLDARAQSLALAEDAVGTVEQGRALTAALPGFLGQDEPRRYFLGVQAPAELRGTGGLIGYYAVLEVDAGRFDLLASDVYDAFDDVDGGTDPATGDIGQLSGDITQGVRADEDFEARYADVAATGLFSNVNVDPDLPTTAEVALDLFELRTGERLDGVILIDPIAMERLLNAIGGDGLAVPSGAAPGVDLPDEIAADELADFINTEIYDQLGRERSAERKLVLRGIADNAFARVFGSSWDGVAVTQALASAASERHVQVYSRDEDEQAGFDRVNATGRFGAPDGADLLSVTANNAVGGKQDVLLGHRVAAEIALSDPTQLDDTFSAQRDTRLWVEVQNPLPTSGFDPYVIGNCLVGGDENRCFDGPPGENRTWFTAWMPGGTDLLEARGDDGRSAALAGRMRGLTVVDRFLETPSESTQGFELELSGRAPVRLDEGALVYELSWWAQAKGIPTELDVTVTPPDGWRIEEVTLAGGGSGRGTGPLGDGPVASADLVDGVAHLTGNVTADTRLEVRMVGADGPS